MVAYAEMVREFFGNLIKCRITPILVKDGSVIGKKSTEDKIALKDKTVLKRALEKFDAAKYASEDEASDFILPSITSEVYSNIVIEMGIQRVQCPYEADSHIARIANDLQCPILTNDSDFIIYNLPKGFVMLDTFNFRNLTRASTNLPSISCHVFSQSLLLKSLPGLHIDNLPLFSILLGNDYVEANTFGRALYQIFNQPYHGHLRTESRNHQKIANLLDWLRGKSLDQAIDDITYQIHPSSHDGMKRMIKTLLRSYRIEEIDNFENELLEIYPDSKAEPNTAPEQLPRVYLKRIFEEIDLRPIALDMILHNSSYSYSKIDDHQLQSSGVVRFRPYSVAATILRPRSYNNMTTYRRNIESELDAFTTYDRINGRYEKVVIKPLEHLENYGSLENLNIYTAIKLDQALKKSIVMATFRFTSEEYNLASDCMSRVFTGAFVYESTICLMLVKYIGRETKLNPKPQFVDALLLSIFYYATRSEKSSNINSDSDTKTKRLINLLKYYSTLNRNERNDPSFTLYRRILHFISQLQYAYGSFILLNKILALPLPVPRIEKFFNGTIIFTLTKLLRLRRLDTESLCSGVPSLFDACRTARVMVHCDE